MKKTGDARTSLGEQLRCATRAAYRQNEEADELYKKWQLHDARVSGIARQL